MIVFPYGSLCSTYAQHGASRDIVLQMKSKVKDPLSFTSFMQDNTPRDINLWWNKSISYLNDYYYTLFYENILVKFEPS